MDSTKYPARPVLIVDDEQIVLETLTELLQAVGIGNVVSCRDSRDATAILAREHGSVVLLDLNMPHVTGMELLPTILSEYPDTPVVVLTGNDEVEVAVRCMKAGAFDFIQKPVELSRLATSVRNAIERWEVRDENRRLCDSFIDQKVNSPAAFAALVTRSPAMGSIFRYVEAIAPTSLPVLITGETGVGKELLARSIHALSGGAAFSPPRISPGSTIRFSPTRCSGIVVARYRRVRGARGDDRHGRPGNPLPRRDR